MEACGRDGWVNGWDVWGDMGGMGGGMGGMDGGLQRDLGVVGGRCPDSGFCGGPLQENLYIPEILPMELRAASAWAPLTRSTETLQQLLKLVGETWAEKAPGPAAQFSEEARVERNSLRCLDGQRNFSRPSTAARTTHNT